MNQQRPDTAVLHNGVHMPWIGLGTYKLNDETTVHITGEAVRIGYRLIDTASMYGNEEAIGKAIRECGVPREDLFVTTKVWNTDQGYETTLTAFEESRKKLGLDYVDLYLVHWPVKGKYKQTWKALEHIYREGLARAIGVCNFHIHHLQDVLADCQIVPMVNQVEFHPLLSQKELRRFCREHRIQLEAWRPLMYGNVDVATLREIGERYGKTPAQVALRWAIQHEVVVIPKTSNPERLRENADVFDFTLSAEEMERIDQLNQNKRLGPDPDHFDF